MRRRTLPVGARVASVRGRSPMPPSPPLSTPAHPRAAPQVDATMAGNIARFMNHSCAPNCYSRIVEVGKGMHDKHIIVFAMRDLKVHPHALGALERARGHELTSALCMRPGLPTRWARSSSTTTSLPSAATRSSATAAHPTAGDG